MEGETMRVMYEPWFVQYKVDMVFAGHVHACEITERISNVAYNVVNGECSPIKDQSAPIYVTIGDGGNLEGLATNMTEPQRQLTLHSARPVLDMPLLPSRIELMLIIVGIVIKMDMLWKLRKYGLTTEFGIQLMSPQQPNHDDIHEISSIFSFLFLEMTRFYNL
ncbi:hypothetical protein H5410_007413 [Solanum commersonii]|uniref:Uncharacterized protein n=1 Tax=Solanum commersonii TaxID=4109 RepID=A0A9J6AD01_SOLCO|nr:hypothetical protein H5410_007413 [Solanum commersonii]